MLPLLTIGYSFGASSSHPTQIPDKLRRLYLGTHRLLLIYKFRSKQVTSHCLVLYVQVIHSRLGSHEVHINLHNKTKVGRAQVIMWTAAVDEPLLPSSSAAACVWVTGPLPSGLSPVLVIGRSRAPASWLGKLSGTNIELQNLWWTRFSSYIWKVPQTTTIKFRFFSCLFIITYTIQLIVSSNYVSSLRLS